MRNNISIYKIILSSLPLILFQTCNESSDISNNNTIYGSGNVVSQTRTVEECSGLMLQNTGNVYLTQDDNQLIRIEADDNIIDNVETRKENGSLLVGLENGSYSYITLKIYVSLKSINRLSIDGAGNINTENNIECDYLNCIINGAGNINLKGTANYFDCSINGTGNISAKEFQSKKCKALVNGAGNITIYVSEELDATVNGVGNIYYYGNPPVVRTTITGLGQIIKR